MKALLALEDGRIFPCRSFTGSGQAEGEAVFNTSMTGYQEILTDPSYAGQMVTMTYPLIGNYGVCDEDMESDRIQVGALIVREYQSFPSNFRSKGTLADYLIKARVLGVEELDTRALTRHIRKSGAMRGIISTFDLDPASLVAKAKAVVPMEGRNLAQEVSTKRPFFWKDGKPEYMETVSLQDTKIWRKKGKKYSVVAMDYGIKYNIIRQLEAHNCEVLVLPASTPADVIKALEPDGIFLSNGPGDPQSMSGPIKIIQNLLGQRPIFGICLGMQLLALAMGGTTSKIKFGHRGGNQPVKNLITEKANCQVTHVNLNEKSIEGIKSNKYNAFGVQYHPEASPGPMMRLTFLPSLPMRCFNPQAPHPPTNSATNGSDRDRPDCLSRREKLQKKCYLFRPFVKNFFSRRGRAQTIKEFLLHHAKA